MRNIIITAVVIVIIGVGYLLIRGYSKEPSVSVVEKQPTTSSATPSAGVGEQSKSSTTITYNSSGFSPSNVTIKAGGTITWVNDSSEEVQIGANPHPIHTGNKELSGGAFVLTLAAGEQAAVTITKTGSHGYHNHKNSSQGGTITVE